MLTSIRQAIFISGKGSNLKALLDTYSKSTFYVFANKNCEGLVWAQRRGFKIEVVSLKNPLDWVEFSNKINVLKIKRIFLLGFMKIIPETFLKIVKAEFINLHPSILPYFPGLNAIEKSYKTNIGRGCTLHKAVAQVDEGTILLQKNIVGSFDFKSFVECIHQFEQRLIFKYIQKTKGLYE